MMDQRRCLTSRPSHSPGDEAHPPRPRAKRRTWLALAFTVLILVALGLRLQSAWYRNHASPDDLAMRLDGDEPHYEALAYGLLQGYHLKNPWLKAHL